MSSRTLGYLLALLVVLAGLYGILTLVGRADSQGPSGPVYETLAELEGADVTRIDIRGPAGDSVVLEKTASGWTVNEFGADSAAVQRLLNATGAAQAGDRVSKNPANHPRLGVSADSAWQLTATGSQGSESRLLLGKPGPSFNSVYVRLPGQDDVFLVTGDLRAAAARPLNEWRDKVIARLDTAEIDLLHVSRNGAGYSIRRADSAWAIVDADSPVDGAAMSDMLGELADLRATGFFDRDPDTSEGEGEGDEPEQRRLVALATAVDTLLVLEAVERGGDYQIQALGGAVLYELPSWRLDRLIPRLDRLAPTTASETDDSS